MLFTRRIVKFGMLSIILGMTEMKPIQQTVSQRLSSVPLGGVIATA